jgi:flagellar secretion chaperone FliS
MKLVSYAQAYRRNFVETATRGQLILMLFDGALRFMNRALEGFAEAEPIRRNEAVHLNLIKTQAIIDELEASLDPAADGNFARTMSGLYDYMRVQLQQANLRKEPAPVHGVVELISKIRSTWSEMLAQAESQSSAPAAWTATAA